MTHRIRSGGQWRCVLLGVTATQFLLLILFTSHSQAARCDTDSSYITFGSAIQGHVLHGPVFQTFAVSSEGRCRELCVESGRCVSYNYGSSNNQQLQTCEVLDRSYKNYTVRKKESFLFQAGKCKTNPCQNDGACYHHGNPSETRCVCPPPFYGSLCNIKVSSCADAKTKISGAPGGLYAIDPDGNGPLNFHWIHCDMTSVGGGWSMCYTTDDKVELNSDTTTIQYGVNGYKSDCTHISFKEIIFIDVVTGQKAYFTRVLDDPTTASANLNQKATTLGLWRPHGAANTAYDYQLLICNTAFYSGFHVSAYTQSCYKRCDNWCADYSSPYFRTAAVTSPSYAGVAFNENGARSLSPRLMSVGLR